METEEEEDNGEGDGDDDVDEVLQAVSVLREFWSPLRGKNAYTQRIFRIRFIDGSTTDLLAEDLKDEHPGLMMVDDNPHYAEVVCVWRETHPFPPPRKTKKRNLADGRQARTATQNQAAASMNLFLLHAALTDSLTDLS